MITRRVQKRQNDRNLSAIADPERELAEMVEALEREAEATERVTRAEKIGRARRESEVGR